MIGLAETARELAGEVAQSSPTPTFTGEMRAQAKATAVPSLSAQSVGERTMKAGRNDPCRCGSGKKYKKCGDLNTEEHQKFMSKK